MTITKDAETIGKIKQILYDNTDPAPSLSPITKQVMDQITNSPKSITTVYLDYKDFPTNLVMILLELNDFTLFSSYFIDAFKLAVAQFNEGLYNRIQKHEIKLRIKDFQFNSDRDEYESITKINELGAEYLKELLLVRGTIVMITENRIKMTKTSFQCINCGVETVLDFNGSGSVSLDKCICGAENTFEMLPQQSTTVNSQVLTIEELSIDSVKNPVSIDVMIDGDLVNKFEVGDIIVVSGNMRYDVFDEAIVAQFKRKVSTNSYYNKMLSSFGGNNNGVEFGYLVEANYVKRIAEKSIRFHDLTEEEKQQIDKLKKNPHLIDTLVKSFCPSIFGEEIKKEALLYQLVGGLGRSIAPTMDKRGEIHVLLFGDASTGKTRLMLFAQQMSSKTRYGVGEGVSRPGLAGGVDTVDNKRILTAGDAVMADMGLLILDELSDIPDDAINALKEIMEKQTATTTKIRHGTFKTRTSVLAGSNPKKGNSYNPKKNFNENVGLSHALMTRFDVIFLFRDIPGIRDNEIVDTILDSYDVDTDTKKAGMISKELLAKYIFLAKNSGIVPQLTTEARDNAKRYFMKLRGFNLNQLVEGKMNDDGGGGEDVPATSFSSRQFEAIIRFATARSRLMFKEQTDEDDIEAAKKIINHMLQTIGVDIETGKVDINSIFSTKTANQENKENQFFSLLEKLGAAHSNKIPKELFIHELRKQSKWRETPVAKIDRDIKGYESRNSINVIDDIISLLYE
jgi:replicative DNA helicase Mcm